MPRKAKDGSHRDSSAMPTAQSPAPLDPVQSSPLRTWGLWVGRAGLSPALLPLVLELNPLAESHEHLQREGVESQGGSKILHFHQGLLGG